MIFKIAESIGFGVMTAGGIFALGGLYFLARHGWLVFLEERRNKKEQS